MVMTLGELYLQGKQILTKAGVESPAFDALELLGFCFGFKGRSALAVRSKEQVEGERYLALIKERTRRPLQYILGRWEFCSMELWVGEGVLIPREDTAVLVERGVSFIGQQSLAVYDLCAGSGAVALAVAQKCKNAHFCAYELSPDAARYLDKNIELYGDGRIKVIYGDVMLPDSLPPKNSIDVLLSNPPYIPAKDISSLAWEVGCEPKMALDGGDDGLDFYRLFAKMWLPCIKPGGMIAVEVGAGQSADVASIFAAAGLKNVAADKDLSGIERVVWAIKGIAEDNI